MRYNVKLLLLLIFATMVAASRAPAINIDIDYTYDNGFFGNGNPQGAGEQARAALEAAADYFSFILADTFSSIQTPPQFNSSQFGGQVTWQWTMNFNNPSSNSPVTLTDQFIPADQYKVFVGARSIAGTTLGIGGPGGFGWSSNPNGGGFTQNEINQLNQITSNFEADVEQREETSGFARWGGTLSFDSAPNNPWHYDHTTPVQSGRNDFFSVAIHELGHALGLGASDNWNNLISGSFFTGPAATAEYGSLVPLTGTGHWAEGTMSTVYGSATPQEAALDPTITTGTRKRLTDLDAAALTDIGWTVVAPPPDGVDGDYNGNGIVDAADYTRWRDTLGAAVPPGTGADGDGNGNVGGNDYTYWKTRFGNTAGSGALIPHAAVPEPSIVVLFATGGWIVAMGSRRLKSC